jgi:ABC-type transporter Mla subunit MlaD
VRAVLEAAEQSAADLRAEAAREIEAQLETARAVTERLSARADEIERSLQTLANSVRDELSALKADLEELRAVGEGIGEARPAEEPVAEPEPVAAATEQEPVAAAPAPEPEPEPVDTVEAPAADGHEGARVIALNMALNGSSREDTARYLSENFELENPDALLDEVYARVGR